jgi:hypothetical protein
METTISANQGEMKAVGKQMRANQERMKANQDKMEATTSTNQKKIEAKMDTTINTAHEGWRPQ